MAWGTVEPALALSVKQNTRTDSNARDPETRRRACYDRDGGEMESEKGLNEGTEGKDKTEMGGTANATDGEETLSWRGTRTCIPLSLWSTAVP